MKKKDIQTANVERLTNKEYRKALRRAKRTKRAAAKAKAAEIKESIPKVYTIMIQYDKRNKNVVLATLDEMKVKTALATDIYAWIDKATSELVETIRNAMSRCTVKYNGKDYKVRVSAMRSKEWIKKEPRLRKPTNNTDEVKREAQKNRKEKNIANHLHHSVFAAIRNARKKKGIVGRKAKLFTTNKDGKIIRIAHGYSSKKLKNAGKLHKHVIVAKSKPATTSTTKTKFMKNKKVVQTELKLAA